MSSIPSITNCALLPLLVLLSPWSFASFIAEASSVATKKSPYKIIFDGGSTGSRLHIFEFVAVEDEDENDGEEESVESSTTASEVQCVRRGSSRANIPLSAFGRPPAEQTDTNPLDPTQVAAHLLPLFDYAAEIIPSEYYETTGVYYQATAGMRLLEESEQEAVYDAVYKGLMGNESFVFRGMQRSDIATLGGEMEAYYGALAANFLQGIIDTELRVRSAQNNFDGDLVDHPVGALDMGGSSTQIVYIANQEDENENDESPTMCPVKQQSFSTEENQNTCRLSDEHFFSTSYLSYGVDQIRKRLWETLVEEYSACASESDSEETTCDAKRIANPCANKGFEVEFQGYTLVGSGDTESCVKQMQRLIPHPDVVHEWDASVDEWTVGGVEHPPIRGKFLAMSLYFFALDSLRVFSKPKEDAHQKLQTSWPTPSIDELQNALDGLCSRDWQGDMELQEGVHSFTRKEVLPHRCLETVYMVTLLRDGFGFHPSSRDITFTFLIDGDEVEWTLGMALAMNANEQQQQQSQLPQSASNTAKTNTATTVTTTTYEYNINETGNNILDEEIRKYRILQRMPMPIPTTHYLGVTMPPTHCC